MSQITNPVLFDGVDINTVSGLTVLATNPYSPAKRKVSISDIANTNKAKVTSAFYNKKPVTVRVGITQQTRALMETASDSLMAMLQGTEKTLLFRQALSTRRYTATLIDTVIRIEGGSYLELDLVFETSDHFGYDNSPTVLANIVAFTSAQKTTQMSLEGSAAFQVPLITTTYASIVGGTSATVYIGNGGTGQLVSITRTWATNDVLEIDCLYKTVKVNGTEVAFTGAVPEWAPGVGYITYQDTFTSRTFTQLITYYKRYV